MGRHSRDAPKPNTNPNANPNTNPNTLTLTLTLALTLTLRCDGWLVPLVTLSLLFVLLVIMICSYVTFMEKHEDLMTTVVTTFSILISHVQTLSIITNLRLAWPESVETVTWLG